jgi:hypothetical protein
MEHRLCVHLPSVCCQACKQQQQSQCQAVLRVSTLPLASNTKHRLTLALLLLASLAVVGLRGSVCLLPRRLLSPRWPSPASAGVQGRWEQRPRLAPHHPAAEAHAFLGGVMWCQRGTLLHTCTPACSGLPARLCSSHSPPPLHARPCTHEILPTHALHPPSACTHHTTPPPPHQAPSVARS